MPKQVKLSSTSRKQIPTNKKDLCIRTLFFFSHLFPSLHTSADTSDFSSDTLKGPNPKVRKQRSKLPDCIRVLKTSSTWTSNNCNEVVHFSHHWLIFRLNCLDIIWEQMTFSLTNTLHHTVFFCPSVCTQQCLPLPIVFPYKVNSNASYSSTVKNCLLFLIGINCNCCP